MLILAERKRKAKGLVLRISYWGSRKLPWVFNYIFSIYLAFLMKKKPSQKGKSGLSRVAFWVHEKGTVDV